MARGQLRPVLRHLRRLAGGGAAADAPDRQLLHRYAARHDEEAFGALVRRHGALVLSVCRSVLGHEQDAEDAFQATFLVLARRAGSVRKGDSVGSFLYGVAYRTAWRAKRALARRTKHQRAAETRTPEQPVSEAALRELQTILHEEVARLPERYRAPFVLCCLEGKSRAEAAAELGWKEGTVSCRVARAREQLRGRLARRGVALTAALAAGALAEPLASAAVPAALSEAATRAALAFPAGAVPGPVAALAVGVLRGMALSRARTALGVALVAFGFAACAALAVSRPGAEPPPPSAPATQAAPGDPLPQGAVRRFGDDRFRHPGFIVASALSPDGKRLATVSPELLQIADVETGAPLRRILLQTEGRFATPGLAFSPDCRYVACNLHPRFAAVWDVRTGAEVLRFADRNSGHALCQFTPDGKLVLDDNQRTRLYEVPSGKEAGALGAFGIARLSPDAKQFARVEKERVSVIVGDAESGAVTLRLDVSTACDGFENGLAFSPDGGRLAVVHARKEVQLWDVRRKSRLASLPLGKDWIQPNDPYYTVAFSGDGSEVLFGAKQGAVYRWKAATGAELPRLDLPRGWYVRGLHSLADGRTLLATEGGGRVVRWDTERGRQTGDAPGCLPPIRVGLTGHGALVVGDRAGRIDVWDVATGRLARTLQSARVTGDALTALAVSPDGRRLATGEGGAVRLLRLADGKEEGAFRPRRKAGDANVRTLCFTPDGRCLCVVEGDSAGVWDVATGRELWQAGEAATAAVSADGRRVATAHHCEVTVADAVTGAVVHTQMVGPQGRGGLFNAVTALAFSPDGRRLACALYDGQIVLLDGRGRERSRLRGTDPAPALDVMCPPVQWAVTSLAFSADGQWLLVGAGDRSVRVWETATGKPVLRFPGHLGPVTQVAFTADGRSAVSAGDDGFTYLWDLRPAGPAPDTTLADDLWRDAAGANAEKGFRAAWALVATTEARRRFLRGHLAPAPADAAPERLKRWIADLSDERFDVREAASRELAARARQAEPVLREALRHPHDAEAKRRLEALVGDLERGPSPDELRALRLVHAAELAGTSAARSLLDRWAGGGRGALLTESARGAVARLAGEPDR